MKRRKFISLLGGAVAAGPLAARAQQAQQPAIPVVGFLHSASAALRRDEVSAFHRGLKETGFVEGDNLAIEYRWAEDHYDKSPSLAADLVRRKVTVIATSSLPVALAAKAATSTIPIIFKAGTIRSKPGWSRPSTGREEISRALANSIRNLRPNVWNCCARRCHQLLQLPY